MNSVGLLFFLVCLIIAIRFLPTIKSGLEYQQKKLLSPFEALKNYLLHL